MEYSGQDPQHQHVREIPVAPQCSTQGQRSVGSSRLYFGSESGSSQAASGATVVGLGVMSQVLSDILKNGGVSVERGKAKVEQLDQGVDAINARIAQMTKEYNDREPSLPVAVSDIRENSCRYEAASETTKNQSNIKETDLRGSYSDRQ
jgi:hypothetical protein